MKTATLILAALAPALFAANPALDMAKQQLGKAPKGFTAKAAGVGNAGKAIVREGKIPAANGVGNVKGRFIEVTGGDKDSNHYTLVMLDALAPNDFSGSVRFRIIGGKVMPVAGIAFRAQDAKNYYLLAVKPNDTRLYWTVFEKGKAVQGLRDNAILPAPGGWHDLKFSAKGNALTWSLNGRNQFITYDPKKTPDFRKGQFALWLRSDTKAEFAHLKLLNPAEMLAKRHGDVLRRAVRGDERVLSLQLVARPAPKQAPQILGSLNAAEVGQPAHADCAKAMDLNKNFHGRKNDVATVTLPLRDKNGVIIGAVRVSLRSPVGTENRLDIARATALVKQFQGSIPDSKSLFQ
ncbi:MAG: hypothetical protein H8E27_02475 [Verrucomicrobia subdivision 3 bacterium]|nr:hypothetical protein [Limisphaerales bacterium]